MGHNESAKVGVVILTYNRLNLLKIALCKVKSQTYTNMQILVVDNCSDDGTIEFLESQNDIYTILLQENTGPAGGFYNGIEYFIQNNEVDYLWLMDDDFFPAKTCLENLLKEASSSTVCYPYVREKDFKSRRHPAWWGVLISLKIINKIGLPRRELFFWGEDTEYLKHRIEDVYHIPFKWVATAKGVHFTKRTNVQRAAWRYYYETRNNLYIRLYVRKSTLNLAQRMFKAFKYWSFLLGGLLLKEDNKIKKLKLFFMGTFHGIFKKLGKRIDPKLY